MHKVMTTNELINSLFTLHDSRKDSYNTYRREVESQTKTPVFQSYDVTDESYVITRVIPGVKRDELTVSAEGENLYITTKVANPPVWLGYGDTIWGFNLGKDADVNHIDAKLIDGVLTVTIPRLKPKKKTVAVNVQ